MNSWQNNPPCTARSSLCVESSKIFFACCIGVLVGSQDPSESQKFFDEGFAALNAEDAKRAKIAFEKAIEVGPSNASFWEGLGDSISLTGDHSLAADKYITSASLEPRSAVRWHGAAIELASIPQTGTSRLAEAEILLRRAGDLAGTDVETAFAAASDLGVVLANLGRAAEAEPVLRIASALVPGDLHVTLQLGRLLAVLGEDRLRDAAEVLTSTLRHAAEAASSGDSEAAGIRDRAISELRGIVAKPIFTEALNVVASLAFVQEGGKKTLPPEKVERLNVAAMILRALSEVGLEGIERAHSIHDLGQVLALNSRNHEALHAYHSALSLSPADTKLRRDVEFNSGVILSHLNRPSEAVVLYKKIAVTEPENEKVRQYLGDALLRLGIQDEASYWYTGSADIHAKRNASFRFLVNFQGSNDAFWERQTVEAQAMSDEISRMELEDAGQRSLAAHLPRVLRTLRDTEVNTTWQVARLLDCAKAFGASESTKFNCGYGISWFDTAWKRVMDLPILKPAIAHARAFADNGPGVVVLGSALGEHCLFTNLLLGISCVGYDLLCDTNVGVASALVPQDAKVKFHCKDALEAELSGVRIVWLLDVVWPLKVQENLEKRLAALLPEGAAVILYRPPVWTGEGALTANENIANIEVSWNKNLSVTILVKQGKSLPSSDEL